MRMLIGAILVFSTLSAVENPIAAPLEKPHMGFLVQANEVSKAIDQYQLYTKATGSHDFELLQELALSLLNQGAQSHEVDEQLLSIFGATLAHIPLPLSFLYECIASPNAETQIACLQLLGSLQDDRCDELINKAMASNFFMTRIHAAQILSQRKAKSSVGQIESLMYRVPPEMRFIFADFFANIGSYEAIAVLKHLMSDPMHHNRLAAILAAAKAGRDDLINTIRAKSTHPNLAEQEACATALGLLKDEKSLKQLKILAKNPNDNISLAALRALYLLGVEDSIRDKVIALASEKNLFAITLLGDLEGSDVALIPLLKDANLHVQLNATLALLNRKNPACVPGLISFLLRDARDIGFLPQFSVGGSLIAMKVLGSASQHQKIEGYDLQGYSLFIRETWLKSCIELPEKDFLAIAKAVFQSRQKELIPATCELLLRKASPASIDMLKTFSQMAGAPMARAYCDLTLLRLHQGEEYAERIRKWVQTQKAHDLVRLRPPVNTGKNPLYKAFELSPEENSSLLVNSCLVLAEEHEEKNIDILLDLIKDGNPKNRALLAGILLNALH